ncbi:hypothetical protein BGZ46_008125 [Entomortierella lignicola]|nr:hypothetical protein BGZ46_008125 [Entomortierella lignicola]
MNHTSTPRMATRATTMYGSTTAISTNSPPVPAPRPKSEFMVAPKRSLPPPPLPDNPTSSPSKHTAPSRPVPTLPQTPLSLSHPHTIVPPKRVPPPPPPPSSTSSVESATSPSPSDIHSDRRVPLPGLRPVSVASQSKPDRHLPPPPPLPAHTQQADDPSVSIENDYRPMPLPRRPTSVAGLAKPPAIRPSSIASAVTPEHVESSPTPVPSERPPVLPPKRPMPIVPNEVLTSLGHKVTAVELPKRTAPTIPAPTPVERPKISTPIPTPIPMDPSRRAVPTALASLELPKRTLPSHSIPPTPELPKRAAPIPPEPDLPKRIASIPKAAEPLKRAVPEIPAPPEPAKRPIPTPPTRPTLPIPQQVTPNQQGSQTWTEPQKEQVKEERPIPSAPSKPPRLPPSSTTLHSKVAELRIAPSPSPSPSLPPRPALPARPGLPARPSLPARQSPPQRPELPQRPTLPARPGKVETYEHHSSSHSSSLRTVSSTTNGASTHSVSKSSSHFESHSSSSHSVHSPGDDAISILSRSQPVVTSEFSGERLDLSLADFSVIDNHARACPSSEEESIARLSWYLTSPFPGDQVAQLRAIFVWVAENIVYNFAGFLSGNLGDNSAETVLRTKTGVCAGFSNLFSALADQQQLGVSQVSGMARGYGIEPGSGSLGGAHAWNAVTINGECLLIDSTWGAGGLDDPSTNQTKSFTPFYFLVRPERFIYSHWPNDARQQFLNPPIHVDVYNDLPFISHGAWDCGITLSGRHRTHTVRTDNDYFELEVRLAKRSWDGLIAYIGANLNWKTTGETVKASCQWTSEDAESVTMTVKCICPSPGTGKLQVYARPAGDKGFQGKGVISSLIVNEGTGSNAEPMMQTFDSLQFRCSIMEPIVGRVQSGVMQMIRLKVYDVEAGFRPVPVLVSESGHLDKFREVEKDFFELQIVLRPGSYKIAYKHNEVGNRYALGWLGFFDAV